MSDERQEGEGREGGGSGCLKVGLVGFLGFTFLGGVFALTLGKDSGVRAVVNSDSPTPASAPDSREQQEKAYEGVYFNGGELNDRPDELSTKMHYYDYPVGSIMANGEPFDPNAFTVATWRYPLGTKLRIRCGTTEIDAVVKDRGPNTVKYPLVQVDATPVVFRRCAPLDQGQVDVVVSEIK